MSDRPPTVDFGAPDKFGAHLFRIEIPAARNEPVLIIEDYGYRGLEGGIPREEERVVLERPAWSAIADSARREFNDRLKAAKLLTGRWHTGTNLVDVYINHLRTKIDDGFEKKLLHTIRGVGYVLKDE